jgi:phospholipid/cholesterol/gamma-HCH transport system ATP-binding protein
MSDDAIVKLVDISKSFGSQQVIERMNLSVPAGKTTVIAGGSGQGKSVTLKLILGLVKPDSGRIFVNGRDITVMGPRELSRTRQDFGVLFQGAALFDSLTVFENVAMPLEERTELDRDEIRDRVMAMLSDFDLDGHENKYPAQLSGGMKKRVGLARALQLKPKIMMFDEPTTGLDPAGSMEIYRLFFKTQQEFGFTSIIVSHDIPKIFNLADQVVILNGGKTNIFSSPEEIQWSDDPEIRFFVEMTMGHVYQSQQMESEQ